MFLFFVLDDEAVFSKKKGVEKKTSVPDKGPPRKKDKPLQSEKLKPISAGSFFSSEPISAKIAKQVSYPT